MVSISIVRKCDIVQYLLLFLAMDQICYLDSDNDNESKLMSCF